MPDNEAEARLILNVLKSGFRIYDGYSTAKDIASSVSNKAMSACSVIDEAKKVSNNEATSEDATIYMLAVVQHAPMHKVPIIGKLPWHWLRK